MYDPYGRLMRVVLSPTSPTTQSWSEQWREYDVAGNVSYAAEVRIGPNPLFGGDPEEVHRRTTRYYYSADKRLVRSQRFARDRFMEMGGNSDDLIEEIRYDALGRRIMVRTRHAPSGALGKSDAITRFVWDGDQLLGELRAPGGEGDNLEAAYDSGKQYGRVSYVHGGDIDRPLGVYRNNFNHLGATLIVPYVNWRGQYERGSFIGGAPECTGSNSNCIYVDWPAPQLRTYLDRPGGGEGDWVGSLLQDQLDESGLLYRRNRYYDPNTGQFTQEDPIGIAGGLNLYGYAAGDPVTYSDPFGLCPDPEPCKVRFVALSGSAALAHIGFNFEIGIGRGTDKGRFVFAKIGPSAGVGVSISIEGGVQYSTTDEFLGNPDGRTVVAGEIEALLLNIPLDVSPEGNWKPTGWGVNIGPGFFAGLNFTARADYVGLSDLWNSVRNWAAKRLRD